MKKTKDFCLRLMCCFLFLGLFCGTDVFAAVQEGKPGETFSGEYAVIINTDTTNPGNTGTLQFDETSAQAADSEAEDYAVVQSGSDASAQAAAAEETAGEAADVGQVQILEDEQLQAYMQDDQPMLTAVQAAATTYQVGEKKYIYRTNGHDTYGKTYVCIGVGEHCYVWMDENMKADYDTARKTSLIAADMAAVYDGQPYRILNQLCAGDFPAQDGSGKLSILLESLSSASGMYMYDEGITAIHINTPSASSYVSGEMSKRNGLLVHEGQHAILWLKTGFMSTGRYSWLNEGLAVAVMDYLWGGTDSSGWLNGIGSNTTIRSGASLIYENYRDDNAQDYGMPYLFVRYVIDRMAGSYQPMKVLPKFYTINASSLSCEQYLEKVTGVSFKELMADFYTAVAAGESSGKYSFYGDTIAAAKAATFPVYAGDSNENHTLPAASAILVKLSNGKFTVPTDGSAGIVYRIIGSRSSSLAPAEGDGTSANPYKISSVDDLNLIQANQGACYRLTKNISTDGRTNFSASYFSGTLDGAGFTITGLQKPLIQQNAGTIKDLNIVADFDYDSHDIHGVVAQYNTGKIQDCKVTGTITGHMGSTSSMSHPAFGGIVGENEVAGTISGCSSGVDISISMTATDSYVGGIAGVNIGTIEKCVAGGNLSVTQANGNSYQVYLGGIAGRIEQFGKMGGYVKQCAFTGTLRVTGGTAVTGQICAQVNANVLNSASGLNGHVSNCYGKNGQGALIGTNTEQTLTTGGVLTAEQMKDPNSYKGWSFDGDWQISQDGLPERADASAIRSLSVSGVPKECYVGEVPAYWGKLIVNNSTSVTITKDMITGFENSETGTRELTINYKGKQTGWSMTVKEPSASDITKIELSGRPKTTYSENQKFDPSGASFFATIGGRYVYIYSGFSYDKTGPLKSEDTSVIFNYFGKEIPVSITVTARKATRLSVLTAPAKTQFTVGNTLDLSGVKLQITYNDGTQTPIFKANELEKYGVHVAFGKNGSFTTVAADKVLESDDSGSMIVFYATDKLPSEYGSVVAASSMITVRSPLTVPALDLYVSAGKSAAQYPCTDNVTGGSGTYATTVIEEKLPAGLKRTNLPGEKYNAFGYTGVVTASAGDYSSQYKISDTETQESIQVTVTIHVVPSDQAAFYSFVLKKVENPGLKQDVIGVIGEDTIVLRVPNGTNVTALQPSVEFGMGMGTELPQEFWNNTKHDFTNPVVYTLTAPDGVTKKSYTVSVEFYDDTSEEVQSGDEILSPADNTKISCKDSDAVILKGWAGDSSKEISLFKYVVNGISYTTSANATTQTIPNARAYEVKISGSSLKEGNNTLEIWVMYADNSGTGSGGTLKKLGTRTVVKEGHKAVKDAAVAATCETAGKTEGSHCSVCNTVIKAQTITAALGHSWDNGKVTKAATCTTAGTKTYTCTHCKKTRTETIAATGHKAVKDAAVAATCETTGKTEGSHCSVCNTVIKAQTTVAALGHSWDGGKVTKVATCTTAGTKTYTCTRCKKTRTETIAATGHKAVKDAAVAATCETAGKTEGSHCSVCGTVIKAQTTTAALGHSWDNGKVTKAATCTTAGTKTYTCTRCKKTRTETIAATGHKAVKDAAVAATCETAGKTEGSHCSVCGTVLKAQTTTAALGHSWDNGKVTKAATCTTAGTKTYTCTRCKKTRTETIAATGHKAVKDAAVAATCETAGKTEGSHCSVCGTVLKAQTTTAALGHSWDGGKVTKAATCTTAGTKTYTCTHCKKTRTETIAATGHKAVKDAAVAATCETTGKTEGSHCSVCNTVIKAQTTTAALGHNWDGGKVTTAATCTTAGTKTYTCTRCKKTRTETIAATGHKAVKDAAVAATCETAGKTEGSHCSVCGTVLKAQTTVAALGHSWDGGKVTKATTCTTAGTKTYTCTRCKKTRTETIAATGHKAVKDAAVAATCETAGKTEGSHCSVCGTVLKAQTTTAALGHDYGEWKTIKAATYTEPGQAERVCRRNASHKEYRQLPILEKAKIALSACSIQLSEQTYVYDGTEKAPTVTITYNEKTLTEGKDYQVYFADNVNPGTAKITVIAKTDSDYTGTATKTFEIRKALQENATVIEPGAFSNCTNLVNLNIKENVTEIGDNAFADSKNLQNIYFYGNSPKLGNNIFKNVTATVYYPYTDKTWSLDILRDYGGNITWVPWDPKTGSPAKRSLALCDIRIAEQKYTYDGTEKTPEMIIMDGNHTLRKNTDYTVKCSNNINAGNAELEITGAGNYSGTYKAGFLIEQTEPSLKFDRKTITVKYGTKPFLCALSEKTTDGTITYSSSNPKAAVVDPATGKVTIKGGGTAAIMAYAAKGTNYTSGSTFCTIKVTKRSNTIKASNIRRTWYVKARNISINAKVYGKAPLKYSSSSKSVKVDKQGRITIAAKFTGSARITIRSSATAGYNAATKHITVTVNPAGTTLTTAKNLSGRKAQITWKKNGYVTGYEIQYSVNKNFRSGSKKTVSGASKTKYTLTKLQKNKTYYVRIRTYKKSGTKKYYSSWSKVKAVRIRK
ncbi:MULTISPECIES: leucine-rich repeat protein [unclassified Blautia]|uniref:leucine-rich repeat protein n=1 Tax=unclassified Blautia TaxID=2648079 RepID=UPI001FD083B7|nr:MULTISPECIES: leucine-rich repeat protein [unclassified Blautia]MCJ7862144.1 leucine-rich repeat protein [Blautia sp. NSJ-157]MCJ7865484.1 leucine-rich repeat protein [Blautia sp. NSJ-140]